MSSARSAYEREIADYLLGRLEKRRTDVSLDRERATRLPTPRVLYWWLFENKRFAGLSGPLAYEWPRVIRQARRLLSSYNPRKRELDTPDGEVDWIGTALATLTTGVPRYVTRTSHIGLSDDEHRALTGWQGWIAACRSRYRELLGAPENAWPEELPWKPPESEPVVTEQVRRWAHIARRSRWPLLRNVVSESLRALLEPQVLLSLPLPEEPSRLFELVCMVRILKSLDPEPVQIRWLDSDSPEGNRIETPKVRASFQYPIDKRVALESPVFGSGLREGIERHGVSFPRFVDGLVGLRGESERFGAILFEAKSGKQDYRASLFQLLAYRQALRDRFPGPIVVWGIVEEPQETAWSPEVERELRWEVSHSRERDIWVFSTADDISRVLSALGLRATPATSAA